MAILLEEFRGVVSMKEKSGRTRYSQTLSPEQIIFVLEQASSQFEAARQLNIDEVKLYRAVRYHNLVGQLKQAKARWKIQDDEDKVFRRQELIGEIKRLAVYFKHTPTAKEFFQVGIPVTRLIENFGSVNNATKAAGLIPNNRWPPPAELPPGFETQFDETDRKQIDERREAKLLQAQTPERQKQIIWKILEVAIRVGHTPTAYELDEAGLFYYRLSALPTS
jgi:hypothetical protein